MREEEIMQITPALWGWYAYGQDEQGVEFLTPVVCGALVESSGNASRLVKRPTPERLRSYARGGR